MKILVVRHAIAEERESFAVRNSDDNQRPLTEKGEKRMRQATRGLKTIHPDLHAIISSPLVRAIQTADILTEAYPEASRQVTPHLAPGGSPELLCECLDPLPADAAIALVGHEPDLSELIAWFCCGSSFSFIRFKKGAVCLLDTLAKPGPSRAEMEWLLTPRQLRDLAN